MKKVLILSAGFGEGHNAAARGLRDALERISDEAKVEILDLFESSYGPINTVVKEAYLGLVKYAPSVWGGLYNLLDSSSFVENRLGGFTRLKNALADILHQTQPDCVVSTYPVYAHVLQELYREHSDRPFRFITIVTDSISVNSAWFRAPSDLFCVPNEATAAVLRDGGVDPSRIRALGFPVNPVFADSGIEHPGPPEEGRPRRILYVINTGKKKAGKAIDRLLALDDTHLTITVGRDAELKADLVDRTASAGHRVRVIGWTNQMPELMKTHHLIIGKAGGATVQEAIAAQCPMIVNQVIPGQEEGNAQLIERFNLGAVVSKNKELPELVESAFARKARVWHSWRENLANISRPDASLRLAELVLAECDWTDPGRKAVPLFGVSTAAPERNPVVAARSHDAPSLLLCDFHIHTNYSDGKLALPDVVDFYGSHGFDCICITDHLADPRRLIGKLARLSGLTIGAEQLDEYFDVCEREARRAWRKYGMLVMTGMEFNKDGYTKKTSAHLLGIDLQAPISPSLDLPETIAQIHAQGGLAVASHPHIMKSEWGKNTLHLWENQETYAPLIDAWEIANRNNLFTPVGLKRLPFLANSDFHKPKHIYSWKTLLHCEKDRAAIKDCVRRNEGVAITLYRGNDTSLRRRHLFDREKDMAAMIHNDPPLRAAAAG
ncbi:MAG: UDP-N-acetylglucosamine--LPS N-acetylglucosamine transferase [Opitutaceae bacterium]|nr:UDP-N-acetylglucosamine--LPS N-acetylglucosamine transferase [Verrucomicrobiales bacterium]